MIAGAALAAWLADRDAQQRSHDRGRGLRAALEPPSADDRARARARRACRPHARGACSTPPARFMDRTGRDRRADARADRRQPRRSLLPAALPSAVERGPQRPAALPQSGSVDLAGRHRRRHARRQEDRARAAPASISFTGVITLFRFLKAGGATLSFWEAPPIADDFVASAGRPLPARRPPARSRTARRS